jgi:hypothetical protein
LPVSEAGEVDISSLVGGGCWAGEIAVIGPLGRDLKQRVAVIEGFQAAIPDRLVGPHETVTVDVSADEVDPVRAEFVSPADSVSVPITDEMAVDLRIWRLTWAVQSSNPSRAAFDATVADVAADEIVDESSRAGLLLVRGQPDRAVDVQLRSGLTGDPMQSMWDLRFGPHGVAAVPLHRFTQTVRDALEPVLVLTASAGDHHADLLRVIAQYEATVTHVDSDVDDGVTVVQVDFDEERPVSGRVVQFWSLSRPWDPPVLLPVPDDADGTALIEVNGHLPPASTWSN